MASQRTVLVIASSAKDDTAYQQQLQQDEHIKYNILSGSSGTTFQSSLTLDGILLELEFPHNQGLQLLRQLKEQTSAPVIVIDGGDTEVAVQAFKHGAADYLVKDRTTPDDLRLAMRSAIENAELKRELQQSQETFRTSVENMLDCFGIFSALRDNFGRIVDFRIDYLNAAACESNQMPKAMQIGRGLCEVLPAHRESGLFDEYCQVVDTGEPLIKDSLVYDDTFGDRRLIRAFDIRATKLNDGFVASWRDVTNRRQMEDALRESEERFRQLAENIDAVFWVKELPANHISYVSPAYQRLWGRQPQHLYDAPRGWFDYIYPADRNTVAQAFDKQATTGEFDQEYRIVDADGTVRWVRDRCFPLYDEAGNIYRLAGIAEDITERQQTHDALLENEQLLRLALAGANAGSWDWNLQTNDITWSPENYDLYGVSPGNVSNWYRLWYNTIHPEDREWVRLEILRAIEQRQVEFKVEFRIVHPQRGLRWLLGLGRFTTNEQGEPIRLSGINLDITDRRQVELRLQESEERLQLGMQVAGFGLVQIDYSTNMVHLSPEAATLYGLSTDQYAISREQFHATFHPEERAQLEQQIEAILDPAGSGWFTQDHRVLWSNGKVKWLTMRKQVFFDRSSSPPQPSHAILVALDITERKQAEMERDRLLQQEQVARAEAERANRIKDEFLAILSHELRSPLNPILGWAKLLQSRKFDEAKTAQALATIERNAKLQTQLIDDLLDVAKILRGKLVMEMTTVDLTFVIESALDTMRAAAAAKSIQLHAVIPQIGRICGDSARLQQVVWNLLSNAIKFTPNHGRVTILLERVDNQAQITVSDTGKGINPEFLPHLFESFRQEDASTTRKYGGLGLGLAIVRSLVEAHGGTITAQSPGEGRGATFIVCFPLLDTKLEVQPLEQHPVQDLNLTGIRVLAVDDEPDARELLATVLRMYGAEVLTVASAAEVLTALASFQPDILVSDIGMPDVDGHRLIQQIRALPPEQGGRMPAIALTAYAREEDHQRAIASGFQQQVTKPLEPEQLVQAVVALVRGAG